MPEMLARERLEAQYFDGRDILFPPSGVEGTTSCTSVGSRSS
jgi:hypothetical protein